MPYLNMVTGEPIYYEVGGSDGSLPVVLLHGATQDGLAWADVLPELEGAGLRTYVIDLPGHGKSGRDPGNPSYDIHRYARCAIELIEKAVGEPVILMGHSMSGGVVINTTLERPHLVRGTVVVDGTSYSKGYDAATLEKVRLNIAGWLEVNFRSICSRSADPARVDRVAFALARCPDEIAWNDMVAFSGLDLRPRLGEITTPIAFVHGAEDWAITVEMAEETRRLCVNAPTRMEVISEVGHFPQFEDPERLAPLLASVIQWVDETAGEAGGEAR